MTAVLQWAPYIPAFASLALVLVFAVTRLIDERTATDSVRTTSANWRRLYLAAAVWLVIVGPISIWYSFVSRPQGTAINEVHAQAVPPKPDSNTAIPRFFADMVGMAADSYHASVVILAA